MAAEKAQLLSRLGRRGAAILNADDPLVLAMADGRPARVRTFGTTEGGFVVADQVSGDWPGRWSFRVQCGNESTRVETNLPGDHLLPSALALKHVQPVLGRMSPMFLANGACIIRDDFNATLPKLIAGLHFLANAQYPSGETDML